MSDDGGPAFPTEGQIYEISENHGGGHSITMIGGVTVRDYFAAKALPALVKSAVDLDHKSWDATAQHAYVIADAMLKERAK